MTLLWVIIVGWLLVGAGLLIAGVRGRRVDDHPLCGRCRYDLVGAPAVTRCPECGTDLTLPKSRRSGNRRKRRVLIAFGAPLLVTALAAAGLLSYVTVRQTNWSAYQPLWMLRSRLDGTNTQRKQAAEAEILRRLAAGRIGRTTIDLMVADFLDIQADSSAVWDPWYGDFIETAWTRDELAHDDLARYLETAVDEALSFSTRTRVRQNSRVEYRVKMTAVRAGSSVTFALHHEWGVMRLKDGRLLGNLGEIGSSSISSGGRITHGSAMQFSIPIGTHTIEMEYECTITKASRSRTPAGASRRPVTPAADEIIHSWTHHFSVPIEVVAEDEPIVDLIEDASLTDEIRRAITVVPIRVVAFRERTIPSVSVRGSDLPVDVAFDVFLRAGDQEWLVTHVATRNGSLRGVSGPGSPFITGFPKNAATVDVILRSNPLIADYSTDTVAIWSGEILFEDVPLERVERAPRDG